MYRPTGTKRSNPDAIESAPAAKSGRIDEPIETDGSKPFDHIPDDAMAVIISLLPIRQWPRLEGLDRHFQRGVILAWRYLRDGSLDSFVDKDEMERKSAFERKECLSSLLSLLINRSPNIESLSGFATFVKSMELRFFRQLIQFRHLKSIDLSKCHVQLRHLSEFLSTFGSRGQLEELRLRQSLCFSGSLNAEAIREKMQQNDQILGPAIAPIADRPALKLKKFIYEGNCMLAGAFLESLDVSALEEFSIASSHLRLDHVARFLSRCIHLVKLNVSASYSRETRKIDASPHPLARDVIAALRTLPSPNLKSLTMNWTSWGISSALDIQAIGQALSELGRRCQLTSLRILLGSGVRDAAPVVNAITNDLVGLSHLWLNINGYKKDALVRLATRLDRLEILRFYSSQSQALNVDSSVIKAIATHQRHLTDLGLSRPAISAEDIRMLAQLSKLQKLRLGGPYITNDTVMKLCQDIGHRLDTLELYDVARISDSGMAMAVKKLVNVRRLGLGGSNITDITLRALASSCHRLEELDLAYCPRVTTAGVQAVVGSCKLLKRLNLKNGPVRPTDLVCGDRSIAFDWMASGEDM